MEDSCKIFSELDLPYHSHQVRTWQSNNIHRKYLEKQNFSTNNRQTLRDYIDATTVAKTRDWRPAQLRIFSQKKYGAIAEDALFFIRQPSLRIRLRLDGGWFGCCCARCTRFSRPVVDLLMQGEEDQSLKEWEEKTIKLDCKSRSSASENFAWSSKTKEYRPQQEYLLTTPSVK